VNNTLIILQENCDIFLDFLEMNIELMITLFKIMYLTFKLLSTESKKKYNIIIDQLKISKLLIFIAKLNKKPEKKKKLINICTYS